MQQRLPRLDGIPAQIELWQVEFDFGDSRRHDETALTAGEQAHARTYRRSEDARRFCQMRALLRRLLGERLDCAPQAVPLVRNAFGKPQLAAPEAWSFNLSHAAGIGLLAIAPGLALGIDVEGDLTARDGDLDDMARLLLAPREWTAVAGRLDAPLFLRHWVAKEAVLKALGLGIGEHLQSIEVDLEAAAHYQIFHRQPHWPEPARLHARPLPTLPGHAAALAWIDT